jgi:hypothetical protein
MNVVVGGRLFPVQHHRANFDVRETNQDLRVAFASSDRIAVVSAHARTAPGWRDTALFASLDEASDFFRHGAKGILGDTAAAAALTVSNWKSKRGISNPLRSSQRARASSMTRPASPLVRQPSTAPCSCATCR